MNALCPIFQSPLLERLGWTIFRSLWQAPLARPAAVGLTIAAILLVGAPADAQKALPPTTADRQSNSSTPSDKGTAATQILDLLVLDRATGTPLADAPVKYGTDSSHDVPARTDAAGHARIEFASDAKYLSITTRPPGYSPIKVRWQSYNSRDPVPQTYTLKLDRGTSLGGRIVNAQGQPISGVTVWLIIHRKGETSASRDRTDLFDYTVKTDSEGRWRCDLAPPDTDPDVLIRLSHPDYISDETYGATTTPPFEKLRDFTGVMVMNKGVPVAGRVTETDGKPIAGAEILQGADRFGSSYPQTKTDAEGRFRFDQCRPGRIMVLTVKATGHSPDLKRIQVQRDTPDLEVRLEPGHVVRGRVVDADGKPVAKVTIASDAWRGERSLMWQTETDADGRFVWNEAPADEVRCGIFHLGYLDIRNQPIKPSDREQIFTLHTSLKVRGTVVDASTGQPIDVFRIVEGIDSASGSPLLWERQNSAARSHGGKFELTMTYPRPGHAVRIEAQGYLPQESRVFHDTEGEVNLTFKLQRSVDLAGVVRDPNGAPLTAAEVIVCSGGNIAYVRNGHNERHDLLTAVTDTDGRYKLPPQSGKFALLVLHDAGYAEVPGDQLAKSSDITVKPWATIRGALRVGKNPGARQMIRAYPSVQRPPDAPRIQFDLQATTNDDGRFTLNRVPAGDMTVGQQVTIIDTGQSRMMGPTQTVRVTARAGEIADVTLGGQGRPVVGRLALPTGFTNKVDWIPGNSYLATKIDMPKPKLPAEWADMDAQAKQKWMDSWRKSPDGKAAQRAVEARRSFVVPLAPDGTFRVEDIPAGTYILVITLTEPPNGNVCGIGEPLGLASTTFTVPKMPGGRSNEPLDLRTLEVKLLKRLKVGDVAPDFQVTTLDGKPLKVSDYKGKFVLLDFWATWCGACVAEMPSLQSAYDAFSNDKRFAMISLSLDSKEDAPRKFVTQQNLRWTQAFLGQSSRTRVTKDWGVNSIPSVWLIGPDGKILAKELRGQAIRTAVENALRDTGHR